MSRDKQLQRNPRNPAIRDRPTSPGPQEPQGKKAPVQDKAREVPRDRGTS